MKVVYHTSGFMGKRDERLERRKGASGMRRFVVWTRAPISRGFGVVE